jgi:ribosomal protein S18 acetylase RimI-like enzyme
MRKSVREMNIIIRRANPDDTGGVMRLLLYNTGFHHKHRPDIYKAGSKKYTEVEFENLLKNEKYPVFVAVNENGDVLGFCFCQEIVGQPPILNEHTTLYIDDICVDENYRRLGTGRKLFYTAVEYAEQIGAYNIELNVCEFNEAAIKFYESLGFGTQKRKMEFIVPQRS